jgi:hypothetical protein
VSKMSKKAKMRDLLCAGLNEIIDRGLIDLSTTENVDDSVRCNLLGKDAKIAWHNIGHAEVVITVWWGIKSECEDIKATKPLNRDLRHALDVCCSAWLERKDGLWLQGREGQFVFDTYCARSAEKDLLAIPAINPKGYQKEGNFYF